MTEHEAFAKLTESLAQAASAANEIAHLRSDQSSGWKKIAQLIVQVRERVFDFAMRGVH